MNGEIIHALFRLFNQGIFKDFPSQVFGYAVDFFLGLIDRYGANWHGRIADNPFPGFMDVLPG